MPKGTYKGRGWKGTYDVCNLRGWGGFPRETDKCRAIIGKDQITFLWTSCKLAPQTVCSQLSRRHYNFCMKQLFFIRKLFLSPFALSSLAPHTSCFPFLSEGTVDLGKGGRRPNRSGQLAAAVFKIYRRPLALTFTGPLRGLFYVAWPATLESCGWELKREGGMQSIVTLH